MTTHGGATTTDDPVPTWGSTHTLAQENTAQLTASAGDPVNLFTGSLYDDETDILPNVAFPATFATLRLAGRRRPRLRQGVDVQLRRFPDRGVQRFGHVDTSQGQKYDFRKGSTKGQFDNPAGLFGTFVPTKEGYAYTERDGTTYVFAGVTGAGGNGRLLRILDRRGNQLSMSYYDVSSATPVLQSVNFTPKDGTSGKAQAQTLFWFSQTSKKGSTGYRTVTDYAKRVYTYRFQYRADGRYLSAVESPYSTTVRQLTTAYAYYDGNDRRSGLLKTISRYVGKTLRGVQSYDYYANRRVFSTTDATETSNPLYLANTTEGDAFRAAQHARGTEYFSYDLFTPQALGDIDPVYTHAAYHADSPATRRRSSSTTQA